MKRTTGSRHQLGEPLSSELADLCEAYFGATETRLIREAVRTFIDARLAAEPEVRRRYEAARDKRLARAGENVTVLRSGK